MDVIYLQLASECLVFKVILIPHTPDNKWLSTETPFANTPFAV